MQAGSWNEGIAIQPLDNASLAERARAQLLAAILEKRFVDKLPNEDVLSQMLNVSRTTIRSALHMLEQGGVITRRRALGTTINHHVRPSALALQRLVSFSDMLREQGYAVTVEAETARMAVPPADLS